MKTPHRIDLIIKGGTKKYNPLTQKYEGESETISDVPCLVNYISQAKVFELYGDRTKRMIIARFMQEQPPFEKAIYDNRTWTPIEAIDAPIKGAVRLKEVVE